MGFMNLLKKNKHPYPLIYMRGLKSEDLVAMIDFLYHGEANVYQENLDSFLGEAEDNVKPPAAKKKTPKQVQPKTFFPQDDPDHKTVNQVTKVETFPPLEG